MSRKIRQQRQKKRIIILCEGESEITYLGLSVSTYKVERRFVTVRSKPFKNLENILTELENLKPKNGKILPYEEIHLVCDKEKLSNKGRQKSYDNFTAAVKNLQKSFGTTVLKVITSFPSFEFCLLLHFPIEDSEFKKLHDDKELIKALSKQHKNYVKANKKWMEDAIFSKESERKISLFIKRAEKIKPSDNNSWTNLFETVEQIINNSIR